MKTLPGNLFGILVPVFLALIGCGLAVWGWYPHAHPQDYFSWSDLIYSALRSIGLSDKYDGLSAGGHNWQLEGARWIGVIVAFWAVLALFYSGLRKARDRLLLRFRRSHLVIVGDTPFANHFGEEASCGKISVVQLCRVDTILARRGLIQIPNTSNDVGALSNAKVGSADRLIIALDDDAQATDLALVSQQRFPETDVLLRLNDAWLRRNLHNLPGAERLRAFTEPEAAARELIRRHPPYLAADALGQARIHSVLIGDPAWLEALMVETILSAVTLRFGRPAFSFFCAQPEAFLRYLYQHYPDLSNAADISAFHAGPDSLGAPDAFEPSHLTRQGPVTAVYCAYGEPTSALTAALAVRERLLRLPSVGAAIFVKSDGTGLERPRPGAKLDPCTIVHFGSLDDIAKALGIVSVNGEVAEKAWHQAYLAAAPSDKHAAKPWNELSEDYRISNQRAVAHVYAKLFELGFDLRPWMAGHDIWSQMPALAPSERLFINEGDRVRLAELEHERWIADRRMNGWVAGVDRDNDHKVHDNFLPFNALSSEVKAFDFLFVDLLDRVLPRAKDGMKRKI